MAKLKYFAEYNGQAVELKNIHHDGSRFTKAENFFGYAPDGTRLKAQRKIEYKSFPIKHTCDARCFNATGKTMRCECSCGGANHGRGEFRTETIAVEVA